MYRMCSLCRALEDDEHHGNCKWFGTGPVSSIDGSPDGKGGWGKFKPPVEEQPTVEQITTNKEVQMNYKHPVFSGLGVAAIVLLLTAAGATYAAVVDRNWAAGLLAVVLAAAGADAFKFELGYMWTNGGLGDRYKLWRKRQFWNQDKQMRELLITVMEDNRWFSHIPVVEEITNRYIRLLGRDWYQEGIEPTNKLRWRLGLDPVSDATVMIMVITRTQENDLPRATTLKVSRRQAGPQTLVRLEQIFNEYRDSEIEKNPHWRDSTWSMQVFHCIDEITYE